MTTQPVRFYQVGSFAVGNRLLDDSSRTVQSDPRRSNSLDSGHRACQGCGEALGARYALDAAMRATSGRLVAVNATGCLEVFSTPYPETSWRIAWLHSLFGNAPAVATGVAAALKVKGRTDVRVVAQAGDGGTVDIGFGCLSGMFERNDDVLFICYDNEAYMNTGVQRSGATPPAARTATTEAVGPEPGNVFGQGKDMPRLAMAHGIAYVATATVADLHDLEDKVERAMRLHGARYLHVLVPCPLGWGSASGDTIKVARLAKETGLFPVFEAAYGEVTAVSTIRRPTPVEAYLSIQRRYSHLFGEHGRPDIVARIQEIADRNIATYGLIGGNADHARHGRGEQMKQLPFAITLEVGSSHANHTGSWRVERPVYVDRMPPCNDACPAGENVQHWLYDAESGGYEAAWSRLVEDNPFPAVMGRICYHPCETACNRSQLDEAVGINAIERFLGDLAIKQGWALPPAGPDTGKRVLVVGGGPSGLSAAYHLRRFGHEVHLVDSAPRLGGMMRYGIPAYRLPRAVLDAEIARVVALGVQVKLDHVVHDIEQERREGGFDAVFLGVGAQLARRIDIPAGDSSRVLDAVTFLHRVADEDPPQLGRRVVVYGGGDTALDAARTARRLGATDATIVYRRNRERMPAHGDQLEESLEEGVTMRWLSTVSRFEADHLTLEKMRLNEDGFPEPTGEFEELDADALVLALGQDTDLSLLEERS